MEKVTISKKALETITKDLLEFWDYLELHDERGRKVVTALDEAIEILGLQPALDLKAQQEREEQARIWKERQAKESEAN